MAVEIKTYLKIKELDKDDNCIFSASSMRVSIDSEEYDYRSYILSNIHIKVYEDGELSLYDYDRDHFTHFDTDQLEHLQKAVEIAIEQRDREETGVE
jgi:hypothetical protein